MAAANALIKQLLSVLGDCKFQSLIIFFFYLKIVMHFNTDS